MWAVSLTDFIQSIIIIIGLVIISFFVTEQVGSVSEVWSSVPNSHKEWIPESGFVSWVNWIAAWMVLGLGSTVSQDIFQRVNSARSVDAAYFSSIIGAILYLIFATLPLYLIIACKLLDPTLLEGDLQLSLPRMVLSKMPIWIQVLFFGSIFSAIMSTCSGALLAPASLLSENMIKPLLKDNMDNKDLLKYTRLALIIIGFISMIIAFGHQDIFELVSISSIFGLVSIFVPYIAALFFGQTNSRSAIMSMLAGTTTWLLFSYYFTTAVNPLIHGLIASVVGWYIPFLLWEERKPSVIV
jgi:Na+/proline symporter